MHTVIKLPYSNVFQEKTHACLRPNWFRKICIGYNIDIGMQNMWLDVVVFTSAHVQTAEQSHMKPVTTSCTFDLEKERNTVNVSKLDLGVCCFHLQLTRFEVKKEAGSYQKFPKQYLLAYSKYVV